MDPTGGGFWADKTEVATGAATTGAATTGAATTGSGAGCVLTIAGVGTGTGCVLTTAGALKGVTGFATGATTVSVTKEVGGAGV